MQTPESIALATPISEADQLLTMEPVVVDVADSLHRIAEQAVQNTACRVIAVVDQGRRLVGVIPVRALVNDIFLKIVPEEFLAEITDYEAVPKYAKHLSARTARDVMLEPVSVLRDETVRDAFESMLGSMLIGIPLTDADGLVTGYVDQLELLLVWVHASGRRTLLEPEQDR